MLGMILDRKSGIFPVPHPLQAAVIEIDVGDLDILGQAVRINIKSVILRGDFHPARGQVLDRLIAAPVAKLEFIGGSAVGKAQHLVAKTDTKDRFLAQKITNVVNDPLNTGRIAGPVGQKDAVRVHGQHIGGRRGRRHHLDTAATGRQQSKLVVFNAEIIGHHPKIFPFSFRKSGANHRCIVLPAIGLLAGDPGDHIPADQTGPLPGPPHQ